MHYSNGIGTRQPMTDGLALIAHWSVCQKN